MKIFYAKDKYWIDKWDQFIINNKCGSHLILSNWLESYKTYGFEYEIIICLENEQIIGGFGAVIAKIAFFKFYILSYGPIISKGNEDKLNAILEYAGQSARKNNCCYMEVVIPYNLDFINNQHLVEKKPDLVLFRDVFLGNKFKYIYSSNGLNWIDLTHGDLEVFLIGLSTKARRNIRASERKELICKKITNSEEVRQVYKLFEENALRGNYAIRDWKSFGESLQKMINQNKAIILGAYKENNLKGAILLIESGRYYSFIMGGTKKEIPDVRAGQFLQLQAIKLSIQNRFDGYNISLGGSKGVIDFKNEFNPQSILFENSKYHWIIKPIHFKIFLIVEKYMNPHKKKISKILTFLVNRKV